MWQAWPLLELTALAFQPSPAVTAVRSVPGGSDQRYAPLVSWEQNQVLVESANGVHLPSRAPRQPGTTHAVPQSETFVPGSQPPFWGTQGFVMFGVCLEMLAVQPLL